MYRMFCPEYTTIPHTRFRIPRLTAHLDQPTTLYVPFAVPPPRPCSYPNPIVDTRFAAPLNSDQPRPCGWPIVPSRRPRDQSVNTE